MCSPAAIGPAVSGIGNAMGISAQNKAKRRAYNHRMKVRERKWLQRKATYKTKKVQFEQEVDLANIAAQRAYSEVDNKLYLARSAAILANQSEFLKMIKNEGDVLVGAAERGISGNSLAKLLQVNKASFGMSQAMRTRGLTEAYFSASKQKDYVRNRLKSELNRSFSKVAVQPVADLPEPPPVMGSPGMALMMGAANALSAGLGGMDSNTMGPGQVDTGLHTQTITPPSSIDYGNTFPAGSFGIGSLPTDNLMHIYN